MSRFNYKCPECGGEFNSFDGGVLKPRQCPFCGNTFGGSYSGGMY